MNNPRRFIRFDWFAHLLIAALAVLSIVLIPLSEGATGFLLILLWPLLGFWQVVSALIMTIRYRDKKRAYYLLAVAIYFLVWIFSIDAYDDWIAFVSLIFAAWYAYLTYKDVTYRTPSFWDLEF